MSISVNCILIFVFLQTFENEKEVGVKPKDSETSIPKKTPEVKSNSHKDIKDKEQIKHTPDNISNDNKQESHKDTDDETVPLSSLSDKVNNRKHN